jgi:hypothetical protein
VDHRKGPQGDHLTASKWPSLSEPADIRSGILSFRVSRDLGIDEVDGVRLIVPRRRVAMSTDNKN